MSSNKKNKVLQKTLQAKGMLFFERKEYEAAIAALIACINVEPSFLAYRYLGLSFWHTDKLDEAIRALLKSNSIKEHHYCNHVLAGCYYSKTEYLLAKKAAEKSLESKPDHPTYNKLYGCILNKLGQHKEAIAALETSTNSIKDWFSCQQMGLSYLAVNDLDKALISLNFAHTFAVAEKPLVFKGLSICNEQLGEVAKSLDDAYRYAKIDKSEESNHFYQSLLYKHLPNIVIKKIQEQTYNDVRDIVHDLTNLLSDNQLIYHCLRALSLSKISTNNTNIGKNGRTSKKESLQINRPKTLPAITPTIVFGISHAQIYEHIPGARVYKYPGATMYSIGNKDSRTGHNLKIKEIIDATKDIRSIVFEFGEVDLRMHTMKISRRTGKSPYDVIDIAIKNYFQFIDEFKDNPAQIIVSGPHAGGANIASSDSDIERNELCWYMNSRLYDECRSRGTPFITLFDLAVDSSTLRSRSGLFSDPLHLQCPPNPIGQNIQDILRLRLHSSIKNGVSTVVRKRTPYLQQECKVLASDILDFPINHIFTPGSNFPEERKLIGTSSRSLVIELPYRILIKSVSLLFVDKNVLSEVHVVHESYSPSIQSIPSTLLKSSHSKLGEFIQHDHIAAEHSLIKSQPSKYLLIRFDLKKCVQQPVLLKSISIKRRDGF